MSAELIFVLSLVPFTGADNQRIDINPTEVVSVREPRPNEGYISPSIKCLIHMADQRIVAVVEDCATVRLRLEGD